MKKKTKNLILLIALFVVVCAGYFALDLLPEKTAEEEEPVEETLKIADFTAEEIESYYYSNSEYEMGFYITENGYVHYEDEAFPVNTASVKAQLSAMESLTAVQKIDSTDKAEYGLDNPLITLSITLIDGEQRNFLLGDSTPLFEGHYLLDVENDTIYLAEATLYLELDCSWSSMVQQEEKVKPAQEQIVDVTVETAGVTTMYISYDEAKEQPWQLTTPEGTFDGDTDAVTTALGAYSAYSLFSTVEYDCTDFSKYGLEEPVTTVTVRYTEEESGEIKSLLFEFGNIDTENNDMAYVRVNGSSYVYGMSEYYSESVSVFDIEELKYVPAADTSETTE